MAQRRKKNQDGGEGKSAGRKTSRSRKACAGRSETVNPDADTAPGGPGGQSGQDGLGEHGGAEAVSASPPESGPSTTPEQREAPQVTLPGELYQRSRQWWWRVKLPGEDRVKARPLKPEGAKGPAPDRETAAKLAFDLWERAVQDSAALQIRMESTEKIEKLKAQFLDRVRHFTELVETANAKIEEEAKARAEAEAKLAQMVQATEQKMKDGGQKTEDRGLPVLPDDVQAVAVQNAPPLAVDPQEAGPVLAATAEIPGPVAPGAAGEPQPPQPAAVPLAPPDLPAPVPMETGACDCCGATGIALTCLTPIDSGQSLCPRCLTALRTDIARLDSDIA